MEVNSIEYSMYIIFTGAAVLATIALFARQAMIVGYILLGILLGPSALSLVDDPELIKDISHIGIIFLLYLLGLDLLPQQLLSMFGKALRVTLISSVVFWLFGFVIGYFFAFPLLESVIIGAVLMFSSTIIGLKLLPTTTLHHKHTGQVIISVLLIQDLIAIIVLLLLQGSAKGENVVLDILFNIGTLPLLIVFAWLFERFILVRLIQKYDQIHEYIFLLAIAWCMGMAQLAFMIGLSHEIGAFIAGITLASSPIALFITERLKPLRDFFLIIFFFSLGAGFNMANITAIIVPATVLALVSLLLKPWIFRWLLNHAGERDSISKEVGFRLGQVSEFSLLIAVLAVESGFLNQLTSNLIQLTTLITFIVSSYIIVFTYPTPIAVSSKLRRD